jgi:hypothetical protein
LKSHRGVVKSGIDVTVYSRKFVGEVRPGCLNEGELRMLGFGEECIW